MSDLAVLHRDIGTQAVPSLFQQTLSCISQLKQWTFVQDVPETAVPELLSMLKYTDFDLDQLPNVLPASLQQLDLTGFHTLEESTLLAIIKKCFSLRVLILKDMPLLNDSTLSKILWYLRDLEYLSLGAGIGSLSILEMENTPNKLEYLEINSAAMDGMWLEHLRYFPHLISLKLRNVALPKVRSAPFKLPPNLATVDISVANQESQVSTVNLFKFFLMEAPNLRTFVYGGQSLIVDGIGPIVAKNLRVLQGNGCIKVLQTVADVISDTCQQLEEVSGLNLFVTATDGVPFGQVLIPAGGASVCFTYTRKKLNHDYSGITSETAWKEGPTKFNAPWLASYVLPIDPCPTLRTLELTDGTVDVVEMLQLFPNLEVLVLNGVTLKLQKQLPVAGHALGSKLKILDLRCKEVPAGAIDLLSTSSSLKRVTLYLNLIPEFNGQPIHLDHVLRKFPCVKHLTLSGCSAAAITITNDGNTTAVKAMTYHPLKELVFKGTSDLGNVPISLHNLDFNRYKQLQVLTLDNVYIGANVTLHNRLRVLCELGLRSMYSKFSFPETLYHLTWHSRYLHDQLLKAVPNMKSLCSADLSAYLREQAEKILGRAVPLINSKLKYLLPPQKAEVGKTNLLNGFAGTNDDVALLRARLNESGSNLTIRELQLIAEMYGKQEISVRSTEELVHVKIRLVSGATLPIICNPSHRVLDLYAYARHAVKLDDKAFDLLAPSKSVLDLSTYDKTVQEMDLANTTLIQRLRDFTPVENELRKFSWANIKLLDIGKNRNTSQSNYHCQSLRPSSAVNVNDAHNTPSHDDDVSMSESVVSGESESESERSGDSDDEEEDSMLISDDDDFGWEPEKPLQTDDKKHIMDQLKAANMRKSREYHEQKEREEREAALKKHETQQKTSGRSQLDFVSQRAPQRRVTEQRVGSNPTVRRSAFQPFNPSTQRYNQPLPNAMNWEQGHAVNNGVMDDEQIAEMLQQDEYLRGDDFVPYL